MTAQWRLEVPGGRKAWPKSIRDRVLELSRLGMGSTAIDKFCKSTKVIFPEKDDWEI